MQHVCSLLAWYLLPLSTEPAPGRPCSIGWATLRRDGFASLSIGATSDNSGSSGSNSEVAAVQGPCDIYAKDGTPCAAAHAMTRALYGAYGGRLYQLTRTSTNVTQDIMATAPGGFADSAAHDRFCFSNTAELGHPQGLASPPPPPPCPYPPAPCHYPSRADCVVSIIYDQSGNGNHLLPATPSINNPASDLPVNATRHPITIGGGRKVYGAYFETGMGYRARNTAKVATGNNPETIYMVTSGTHINTGCCFDYGNSENDCTNRHAYCDGCMEAVYFGSGYGGEGKGQSDNSVTPSLLPRICSRILTGCSPPSPASAPLATPRYGSLLPPVSADTRSFFFFFFSFF